MTCPSDIPQWAYDEALAMHLYPIADGDHAYLAADDFATIARALVAAEARGMEKAAALVENSSNALYERADVNLDVDTDQSRDDALSGWIVANCAAAIRQAAKEIEP